jgi:hypothetical protein
MASLNSRDIRNSNENYKWNLNNIPILLVEEKEFFDSDNYNLFNGKKLIFSRITKNNHKSSLFKKQIYEKKIIEKFEKNLGKKLLEFFQNNKSSNSKLIYLEDLIIPFPLEDNLEKIKSSKYIFECIEEIKENILGKYFIKGFQVYTASKENMNNYMSSNNIENNDNNINRSFYFEEDSYIGINFKLINNDTYIIYFLHAINIKKSY